jgi:nucleoside-diphosphate-sugar epimerase
MKVLVTGAGGFIGEALVAQLLAEGLGGQPLTQLTGLDLRPPACTDPRWRGVSGNIADPAVLSEALREPPEVVFHLASLPGGAAEAQPLLGRQINLDATVALLEALHRPEAPPRVVYASSVAVYGERLPERVDDHTPTAPGLSYGAHKLMGEILLADAVRRGGLRGCSLRLPGVVARPGEGAGLMSAFMSQLFWRLRDGEAIELPVRIEGSAWWISVQRCAANLRAAASADLGPTDPLGARRVALMPALWLSMQAVVDALARRFGPERAALVSSRPQERVDRLFAQYPPLATPLAEALGLRHDGSADGLVRAVLGESP